MPAGRAAEGGFPPEGIAALRLRITTEGDVSCVFVHRSSGNERLDRAAVTGAKGWRYAPASENGKPVETPWKAKVEWALR